MNVGVAVVGYFQLFDLLNRVIVFVLIAVMKADDLLRLSAAVMVYVLMVLITSIVGL